MAINNFTKLDFSKRISGIKGYSISYSKKIIEDLINLLTNEIKKGELNLKNVGKFRLLNKSKRVGRNPKTGEIYEISSRQSVSFISSKKLLDLINN